MIRQTLRFCMACLFSCAMLGATPAAIAKKPKSLLKKAMSKAEAKKGQYVALRIKGMSCGGCVSKVTKALKAIKGVKKVQVSLEKGRALIACSKKVKATALVSSVQDLGYDVSIIKAQGKAKKGKAKKKKKKGKTKKNKAAGKS